jgi:hypothetical protein
LASKRSDRGSRAGERSGSVPASGGLRWVTPGSKPHDDLTLSSRFECKYTVSPMLVDSIRQFIGPFVRPDPFAAQRPGYRYPICSLYLDSANLHLYQQTVNGEKNRFKLRVRSYSDDPDAAVFFEVKRKINNIVKKRRARLDRSQAQALLADRSPAWGDHLPSELREDVGYFANHVALTGARPVVKVRYVREAYESRGGDPVRVTLDTALMHCITLDDDIKHARGRWTHTPVDGVILELKFTDNFPSWIHELVRLFGLKQRPVPKYVLSVDHMLSDGRDSALALAGFLLPPRMV